MLKIIHQILYGLAIFIGLLGLVIGGDPLVKYALEMWRDAQGGYYYDTHYLNEPEIIVLLSLILLVGVRIAMALDQGTQPSNSPAVEASRQKLIAAVNDDAINAPLESREASAQPVETADEKLTRLLNKKD
jgi:hypothetical protein